MRWLMIIVGAQMDPWKEETGFTWFNVIGFHTHSVSLTTRSQ